MEKETYESYEFLPASNAETEPHEQFFVVQDDGTFLINRQVQYVTQVQNVKEVLDSVEGCTVYDVTPQQFYVDVDNSAGLISVPENFILPDTSSNIYGNSYLLQPVAQTEDTNQIEENPVEDSLKNTDDSTEAIALSELNKKYSNCTEVTLSDEQYNMLEQKGWILLETNEKVYILDTLGLHDITTNGELIQQLKSESQSGSHVETESSSIDTKDAPIGAIVSESNSLEHEITAKLEIDHPVEHNIKDELVNEIKEANQQDETSDCKQNSNDNTYAVDTQMETLKEKQENKKAIIRIKTNFSAADITNKIVLGKTVNGKRLVAKVVKSFHSHIKSGNTDTTIPKMGIVSGGSESAASNVGKPSSSVVPGLYTWQFENLLRQSLVGEVTSGAEHVAAAKDIVTQLIHTPGFQCSVKGTNVCVTKTVKGKSESEETSSLVTGRLHLEPGGRWQFVHVPNLLRKLMAATDGYTKVSVGQDKQSTEEVGEYQPNKSPDAFNCLHVHVTENKPSDTKAVSVTVAQRQIPRKLAFEIRKNLSNRIYACSTCAAIYKCEKDLSEHQESHCTEADDALTIDTEDPSETPDYKATLGNYYIVKTSSGTVYACVNCSVKFTKLGNCLRHVKTHIVKKDTTETEPTADKPVIGPVYKCKMCSSSYYHPSTLSKHIVSEHIHKAKNPKLSKQNSQ